MNKCKTCGKEDFIVKWLINCYITLNMGMDFLVPIWITHISQFSNNPDIIVVFKGPERMCGRLPTGFSISFVGRQVINALKLAVPFQSLVFQSNVKYLIFWNCLEISFNRYKDIHTLFEIIDFDNNLETPLKGDYLEKWLKKMFHFPYCRYFI